MAESSDFSSDLQRIFFHAIQLTSNTDVEEYLDRECGSSSQDKQLILRMVEASRRQESGPLSDTVQDQHAVADLVSKVAEHQTFLKDAKFEVPSISRYRIHELLGEGAMGRVFLAEQLEPIRRYVALKVIKPGMDSAQVLARFESEKQTLAMLDHPNICEVFDAGTTDRGYPYFSMELVKGNTVDEYCRTNALSIDDRIRLIISTCKATHHAHLQGIIHRDLKPSNVLVKDVDGHPVVKVIDFGVAKALTTDPNQSLYETYFKQLIGTPLYMCPEQVMVGRKQIDARCDVYSLGGLLYKLVTGYEPIHRFDSSPDSHETLQQLILDYVPPLASRKLAEADRDSPENLVYRLGIKSRQLPAWRRQVRGDLENVLSKTLEKDPDSRYSSALELADDLQRVIDRVPVVAKRRFRLPRLLSQAQLRLLTVASLVVLLISVIYLLPRTQRKNEPLQQVATTGSAVGEVTSSSAVNNEALDYIEASRLQSMFKSLADHDLHTLSSIQLPKTASGKFLGEDDDDGSPSPSLRRLLERLAKPTPLLEMSSDSAVHDFCVSPDKRYVVAGYEDRHARIWSLEDGKLLGELPEHAGSVTAVLFSSDGKILLTGDQEGVLTIWDASSLAAPQKYDGTKLPIIHLGEGQDAGIESLALSPNNRLIAVGHRYDPIIIRDLTGTEVSRIDLGEPHARNESLYFSQDGSQIICSNRANRRIEWWNYQEQKLIDHTHPIEPAADIHGYIRSFSIADDKIFCCFDNDSQIAIFERESKQYISSIWTNATKINSLSIASSRNQIFTGHKLGAVCVSDLKPKAANTGSNLSDNFALACHSQYTDEGPTVVQVLSEEYLLTSNWNGKISLWSLDKLSIESASIRNRDGYFFVFTDGTVCEIDVGYPNSIARTYMAWQPSTSQRDILLPPCQFGPGGPPYFTFDRYNRYPPYGIHDKSKLLAFPVPSGIDIYRLDSGAKVTSIQIDDDFPYQLCWSNDGRVLAGLGHQQLRVWHTEDNGSTFARKTVVPFPAIPDEKNFGRIKVSRNGLIAAVAYKTSVSIIDLQRGSILNKYALGDCLDFEFSPDGKYFAISRAHHLSVYEISSWELAFQGASAENQILQFCDNGKILLGTNLYGSVNAWHIPTWSYLGQVYSFDPQSEIRTSKLINTDNLIFISTNYEAIGASLTTFGYSPE